MYRFNPFKTRFSAPEPGVEEFKVNNIVQVIGTPYEYKITRIDCHAYPICAGGYRYKPKQLKLIREK